MNAQISQPLRPEALGEEKLVAAWNQKFQLVFNGATLLLGFESFILSSYLDNSATLPTFSAEISWAVLLIMNSLIINMFVGVLSAHMSGFAAYEPWHVLVLHTTQWLCGIALAMFVVAINLLVADSQPLANGYKIAIYATTGICFLAVVLYYTLIYASVHSKRLQSFLNSFFSDLTVKY